MKPIKSQYGDFCMISRVESTDGNPIKITLDSRYGVPRTLEVLDEKQGFFALYGESNYIRQSTDMFDFEGGPFVMIGEQFFDYGTVTAISQQPQTGMTPPFVEMAMIFITIEYNDKYKKILAKGKSLFELEEADANNKAFREGKLQ